MKKKLTTSTLLLGICLAPLIKVADVYAFEALNHYTNNELTFTIRASDDVSGIRVIETPDGNKFYFGEFTQGDKEAFLDYQIHTNGNYTFTASDVATNKVSTSQKVERIDKNSPTIKTQGNPSYWTNKDVRLTIQFQDKESGLAEITFPDGTKEILGDSLGGTTSLVSRQYTIKQNGSYEFQAKDSAGNITTLTEKVVYIDKASPGESNIEIQIK